MITTTPPLVIALDQGTTSTRAVVFDGKGKIQSQHQLTLTQYYPGDGWVEHDPEEIWRASREVVMAAVAAAGEGRVAAIGITNQRETTVVWDRKTGRPIANAIVWQDRRTAEACARLKAGNLEAAVQRRSGLLLDPYFSATKIGWLLDHVPGARARAEAGELAFGTIDSWLVYKLTGGAVHATDATNASRTSLFNIADQDWDEDLLSWFAVPRAMLPEVRDSAGSFGTALKSLIGADLPIMAVAGDQQAAAVGQACLGPGFMKSTYGTGCFALAHTGPRQVASKHRLLTTVATRLGGETTYALEGSIFMAGATIQWLRDKLRLFDDAAKSSDLAQQADPNSQVMLVPAFTGLGAPYWDPDARGAILGLTRNDGAAEIARAGLESVSFQTRDLLEAMAADLAEAGEPAPHALRVDGGMVVNDWFCQNLADLTGRTIERPVVTETTALGAAFLAGLGVGAFASVDEIAAAWRLDRRFEPMLPAAARDARYARWQEAVAKARHRTAD
ncbi:Glycerol kinase [Alphaproteobacteria bacterium SO-S41]|nr:Glycerol kinase [Alphaproteobacteria bacterium SO-S41]